MNKVYLNKKKKILTNFLVLLVLLSNASFVFSSTFCEMTKKPVCNCSMNNDDNTKRTVESISSQIKSCCKTEIKFISNSSDYESYRKISKNNISTIFIPVNFIQILNPISSDINCKEILLIYKIPDDIPIKNSSLLI
jgi:hypothetical protein